MSLVEVGVVIVVGMFGDWNDTRAKHMLDINTSYQPERKHSVSLLMENDFFLMFYLILFYLF